MKMTAMEIYTGTEDAAMARRERRRALVRAALIILGIAVLPTMAGWMPGRVFGGDDSASVAARLATEYAAGRLAKGEVPLWNPNVMLGGPVIGDGQTGVFFPTILLHMILPSTWAWTISAVVRLWVAGFGVVVLYRKELRIHNSEFSSAGGASVGQAPPYMAPVFAGVVYMLSGMSLGLLNASAMNVLPLLPWGMVIAGALFDRVTAARVLGMTVFLLVVLLGGDESASIAVLLACVGYIGWRFANEPRAVGKGVAALLTVVGAAGAAWLMAAVDWMPGYYNAREVGGNAFVASARGGGGWVVWWVGVVPLVLAIVAAARGVRKREVIFWLTMVVISLLVYALVDAGGNRSALLGPAVLAVAMLSARGLGEMIEKLRDWPWLLTKVAGAVVALAVVELMVLGIWKNRGSSAPSDEMMAAVKWVESQRDAESGATVRFATDGEAAAIAGNVDAPATMMPARAQQMREALRARVVKYLITEREIDSDAAAAGIEWKPVYPSTQPKSQIDQPGGVYGVVVYENASRPLPRAWVARNALWVGDAGEALAKVKEAGFDPRETVILDRGSEEETDVLRGRRAPIVGGRGGVGGNVQIVEDSPERVRISTQGVAGGWLVLADAYAPGWRAKMSYVAYQRSSRRGAAEARLYERELAIVPANGAMRAVALQGGAEVVLEYAPQGWRKGLMVAAVGAFVLMIMVGAVMFPKSDETKRMPT